MKKKILIGSRGSKLALIYAQNVKNKILENSELNPDQIIIKGIVTKGDQIKDKRLSEIGGKGLFSKNIEKELIDEKIDIAVHALKDMPAVETKSLLSNFFLKRNDPREILISRDKRKLKDLSKKSIHDLEILLNDAIQKEDYERASLIRDEINKRQAN